MKISLESETNLGLHGRYWDSLNISDTDKFYQLGDDLMLITFGQDHTGTYTCKADNAFGHIESEPAEISLKCKFSKTYYS